MSHVIEMLNIRKEFPGIVANDDITLQVEQGEIHAILGENGAGKSTLMSILFGLYHADKGIIKVRGKEVHISSPNDAGDLGIGMVHQHFQLVQNFTVTENIILGREGGFVLDRRSAGRKIKALSEQYGLKIDPNSKIEDITVGMQQRVEILKMLYRDAEILIFDEPTAVLTPQEIEELMQIMRNLIKEGKSIILITHKLNEIKAVADRCTVIRRGKVFGVGDVAGTSQAEMASMMVGRPVSFKVDKKPAKPGKPVLELKDVSVMNIKKVLGVKNFSLQVREHEIVGIAGVDDNGQSELVEAISGLRPVASGTISINGVDITHASIRARNEAGLGHIPEDRQKRGLVMTAPLSDNMVIKEYYRPPFSKHGILQEDLINKHAQDICDAFDVRSGEGIESLAGKLSGGNQQKAIIAREIHLDSRLLIFVQPTRGLDVGAISSIHKRIDSLCAEGKAILLVSLELDEIMELADTILVMYNGRVQTIRKAAELTKLQVGEYMMGVHVEKN